MKKTLLALSITAVLAFSVAQYGFSHNLLSSPQLALANRNSTVAPNQSSPEKNKTSTAPSNNPETKPNEQVEVTLFFGDDQAMYLAPEKRMIEKTQKPLAQLVVEQLIQGPTVEGLTVTIPKETKVLSVEVKQGIAVVNLSKEAQTKHWGGSTGENMTVYSIVNTLTQFPQIKKVQFLIEGKKQEAIWGNIYTMEPIAPNADLIAD